MAFPVRKVRGVCLAAALVTPWGALAQDAIDASRNVQDEIDQAGRQTQKKIDQLSNKAREMLDEYRRARDETASLEIYNEQLAKQVASQNEEIASVQEQLANIDATRKEFVPFMVQAIDTLEQFVARDIPFLKKEREQRVRDLRGLMERADVTTAEKFRKIMKAYQTEIDYGRNIGTYEGELEIDGKTRTVQFLRVGRVALLYQTLDGHRTGFWNTDSGQWEPANGYRRAVEHGIQVASEQAPPDLLHVPLSAPRETPTANVVKAAADSGASADKQPDEASASGRTEAAPGHDENDNEAGS